MEIEPRVNLSAAYSLYGQRSTDSCEHYVAQSTFLLFQLMHTIIISQEC